MSRAGTTTKEILLGLLSLGGIVTVVATAVVAPGILVALAPFLGGHHDQKRLGRTIRYLKREQLVYIGEQNGQTTVELTGRGRARALAYRLETMHIPKPKRWDRRWRVVIFDIPNKRKVARDMIRHRLRLLGFRQLQESVWIHPYRCDHEIDFLSFLYEIRPFLKVMTVSQLPASDEERFRHVFNLK